MAVHKCMLLASREKDSEGKETSYAWDYAQIVFKELQERRNGFELNPINIKKFPDGERLPNVEQNLRKRNCYTLFNANAYPPDFLTDVLLINQALAKSQAQEIIDVFPYMKFSRQDRKDKPRVSISARAFARVVQLDGDRVLTIDAHNRAIDGMYDITLDNLSPYPTLANYIKKSPQELDILEGLENLILMSPDKGGAERLDECAEQLGVAETIVGDKKRRTAGKVDRLRIAEKVEGRNIMIVDDMVDSGGTGKAAKDQLKLLGAKKVFLYATSALCTKGLDNAIAGFDRVYFGDVVGIPLKGEEMPKNLRLIPFAPLFAEAIYRTSEGKSLSELFN